MILRLVRWWPIEFVGLVVLNVDAGLAAMCETKHFIAVSAEHCHAMILVTGATGQLGTLVLQQLKAAAPKASIGALVRRPEAAAELEYVNGEPDTRFGRLRARSSSNLTNYRRTRGRGSLQLDRAFVGAV